MARTDPSQLMQLAQSLARQAPAQAQMPDYGADINSINRDYALADALAQQQYIPDSGWLGALAQIASAGAGAYKASKADKRAAELTKRMNTDAQGAQQAEAERQAAARAQQIQQIAEAYKIDPQQAAVVADGLGKAADFKAPDAPEPKYFKIGDQLVSVGPDGKPQVAYSAPASAAAGAPKAPVKFGKDLDALVAAGVITEDEAARQARVKAGIEVPPKPDAKPKELPAEARNKLALYQNALREAEAYRGQVVGEGGEFNDIASRMPGAARALQSAVSAKLRAESGASIPPEEAAREAERYGPRMLSSDATNVQAVDRLIADLQNQIAQISGGRDSPGASPQQAAQEPSVPTATNDAGEVIEYRNGQWVKKRK